MSRLRPWRLPPIIAVFLALDLLICLGYLANLAAGGPSVKVTALLDLQAEGNLPTWYSSMQLLVVAGLTFLLARADRQVRGRWSGLALLPGIFLLLSIDEVAEIHEWLGYRSDALLPGGDRSATAFGHTGIWMFVIAAPALLAIWGTFLGLRRHLRRAPGALGKYLLGVTVLIGGAAGGDLAANFVAIGSAAHAVEVFLEELAEMVGATILLWGTWDLLLVHGLRLVLRLAPEPGAPVPAPGRPPLRLVYPARRRAS